MTLGEKIRYYREKQKIGQEHLAALSHISVSTIRKYEADERNPKEDQLERLAHALHVGASVLRDHKIDDFTDVVPVIFEIGEKSGILFEGEKDEQGKYIPETFSIKFSDPRVMQFLIELASKKDEIESVIEASRFIKDSATSELVENRLDELSLELEDEVVLGNVVKGEYILDCIEDYREEAENNLRSLEIQTYTDALMIIKNLVHSPIVIECLGVWERIWEGKAYFTINADSINDSSDKKIFLEFLSVFFFYGNNGYKTECFGFREDGVMYYRFIIYDRKLAQALSIINDVIDHEKTGFYKENDQDTIDLFEKNIKTRMSTYGLIKPLV